MPRKIEILAPGGDLDSIKAAIVAGADAIYCGLAKFNARNRATNIEFDDLNRILKLAHDNNCQVFLTINIIIVENEIRSLVALLNRLVNTGIDGVIVQDLGLLYLLSQYFKSLKIHASTQLTTHNEGQIRFLSQLSATRVNLSRELNLTEIKALAQVGHAHNLLSEVFVHGSNCLGFSGVCYLSSVQDGKSGNRGRCSQPCRERYLTTPVGMDFPLNLKDNSAYKDLPELYAAGVDSVKIEGRVKKFHYVYTVVDVWRRLLDDFYATGQPGTGGADLYRVFNRDFSNAFLQGAIDKDMYIDNPRDNSARHYAAQQGCPTAEGITQIKNEIHASRTAIIARVKAKIALLDAAKTALRISLQGKAGASLKIRIATDSTSFEVFSKVSLLSSEAGALGHSNKKNRPVLLDNAGIQQLLGSFAELGFDLQELNLENLRSALFLPNKELSAIKKRILACLTGSQNIAPAVIPRLEPPPQQQSKPRLSVLISSSAQLHLCQETTADIYFELPSFFQDDYSEYVALFDKHKELTPWFPSVLIGKDYAAAVDLLSRIKPARIVTNNTGIAFEAYRAGIDWIAGPYLNCVNSFSLLCLQEEFNCSGAFISNELRLNQIEKIVRPADFQLYYSIYHPILLLTSRQCLFHQIEGCDKSVIDEECRQGCQRSSSIENLKEGTLVVDKTPGCYHRIFNQHNYLNSEVVRDLPGMFASFFIDLSAVKTATTAGCDKVRLVEVFEDLLSGDPAAHLELATLISPTTHAQYQKGI